MKDVGSAISPQHSDGRKITACTIFCCYRSLSFTVVFSTLLIYSVYFSTVYTLLRLSICLLKKIDDDDENDTFAYRMCVW